MYGFLSHRRARVTHDERRGYHRLYWLPMGQTFLPAGAALHARARARYGIAALMDSGGESFVCMRMAPAQR